MSGTGGDTLEGGASSDSLTGGAGNDLYVFKAAGTATETDTVIEEAGGGTDRLDFAALPATAPVTVDLASGTTTLASHTKRTVLTPTAEQGANFENVTGGAGNDSHADYIQTSQAL